VTTSYAAGDARDVSFSEKSHADIERTYRVARRHSRHVRLLRAGLLVGIVVMFALVVIALYIPPLGEFRLPAELAKLVITGRKITMAQPRLNGYTTDARPYSFTANSAAQDISRPEIVELQQIQAQLAMEDKSTVNMTADLGTYDAKANTLKLHQNIVLTSSTGYEGRLSEASVDMQTGDVVSDSPVWVKLLNGDLNSKRLKVVDHGDVLRFEGGVEMILQSGDQAAKSSQP